MRTVLAKPGAYIIVLADKGRIQSSIEIVADEGAVFYSTRKKIAILRRACVGATGVTVRAFVGEGLCGLTHPGTVDGSWARAIATKIARDTTAAVEGKRGNMARNERSKECV